MQTAVGHINEIDGIALVKDQSGESVHLIAGMAVYQDQVISTSEDGAVSIQLVNNELLTLGSDSVLTLDGDVYLPADVDQSFVSSESLNHFFDLIAMQDDVAINEDPSEENHLFGLDDGDWTVEDLTSDLTESDQIIADAGVEFGAIDLSEVIDLSADFDENNLNYYLGSLSETTPPQDLVASDEGQVQNHSDMMMAYNLNDTDLNNFDDSKIDFTND